MKSFSTRRTIPAVVMVTVATLIFLATGIGGASAAAGEPSSASVHHRPGVVVTRVLVTNVVPAAVVDVNDGIEVSAVSEDSIDRGGNETAPAPRTSAAEDGTPTAIAAIVLLLVGVVLVLIWWRRRGSDSIR